ncbi:MAG TPA: FUSC family membrane protein [Brumimicrobium sp.]|nr:FUSC family membrane protein [Brumimicrobium sp.]
MTKSRRTQFELFIKSSHFFRGVVITASLIIPLLTFNVLGYMSLAPSFIFGAFLNAPSDVPGSLRRKVIGTLVSIVLTTLVTVLVLYTRQNFFLILFFIAFLTFGLSFLSAYGFRGSLVGFSSILAMILALVVDKTTSPEIWVHAFFMFTGGLWYILASVVFHKIIPKKDEDQLLSETLKLTGEYIEVRAKLLTPESDRESLIKETYVLQSQINEKHETLREILLASRKRSGRSHFDEKRLLMFISLVDILELVIANSWDYDKFDDLFGKESKHLEKFSLLNTAMSEQLIELSDTIITKDSVSDNKRIETCLLEAHNAIADYISIYKLPQAREGALTLRHLHDYQKQILQEVQAIRHAMANINITSKVALKRDEADQFLTPQEYRPQILIQHFSKNSVIFRHASRLTIAMIFAYVLGNIFEIQNAYWIMLTVLVILRPNYGLTKERAKDRILGTVIGGVIAFGIVILTQNPIIYGVLAVTSLILAFALMQQNFRWAAMFVTLNIVFVYSFIHPDAFSVIQYRVFDTVLGGVIAFLAIYTLFPSWEVLNLKAVLLNAITKNNEYLKATQEFYENKEELQLSYKVARKEAFLALSELSAAFQRITQDPKSKQVEFKLIYDIVTLNQTILSGIASLGSFINSHKTTPISLETSALFSKINNTLSRTAILLDTDHTFKVRPHGNIREAKEKLLGSFQELSEERDASIKEGVLKIKKKDLHELQEAHLVSNQLIWLVSLSSNLRKAITKYVNHFG